MPFSDDIFESVAPWSSAADLLDTPCACEFDGDDVEVLADAEAAVDEASSILFVLSGRTIQGLRDETVHARRMGDCTCPAKPGWCPASVVFLQGPVNEINSVTINGDTVAASGYAVYDHSYLVRLADADGKTQHWPVGRPDVAVGEDGEFLVDYTWGINPPQWATDAVLELACNILKAKRGVRNALPGATSVSVQGASWSLQGAANQIRDAKVDGMPAVERFLSIVNPRAETADAFVFSFDLPRHRRAT